MSHHTMMGTIRTDTYCVTIEHSYEGDLADVICDLEDEIVDKACLKYHKDWHFGNHHGDHQEYTYIITQVETSKEFHAFTSGIKAKDRLGSVTVTVWAITQRM